MSTIYNAQLDGFSLEIEHIDDGFDAAIVQYQYPYKNGAALEHMGQKARTIRFRCYFINDNYLEHISFLDYLKGKRDLMELTHPQYGLIKGFVQTVSSHHDDRQLTVEVDITFIEHLMEAIAPQVYQDIQSAIEKAFKDGQSQLMTFSLSGLIQQAEAFISTMDATLNTVTNPANSLIATIDYGTSLPGRVCGSIARTAERYSLAYASLKSAPARFMASLRQGVKSIETAGAAAASLQAMATISGAQYLALQTAYAFQADQKLRQAVRQQEQAVAFDVSGKFTQPPIVSGILTANELEQILASVRSDLQAAITLARSLGLQVEALQQMAALLLEHVDHVKLERERIITIQQDNPIPLHILCLKNSLPYAYASRIAGINRFRNPNFVKGDVRIYAR